MGNSEEHDELISWFCFEMAVVLFLGRSLAAAFG